MMKYLKKLLVLITVISLIACSNKTKIKDNVNNSEVKKLIYTTFFPVYELTKMIVGDKMDVEMIIKADQQPHNFELQFNDMKEIIKADLVIYNGANMEVFIEDLKAGIKNDDKFLDLSQGLVLLSSEEDHDHDHDHDHDEIDLDDVNPHTWLSVKNAMIQLDTIYQKIASIDSENDDYYRNNLTKATAEFKKLDEKFEQALAKINKKKYFVVSHAAFNYLAHDYDLKQVAVVGISPDEEPSAKQLKEIADFVKQKQISTIFFEGKATPKVAETLALNTNTKTGILYTLENLSSKEMEMGYIKLMELNLKALVESFND